MYYIETFMTVLPGREALALLPPLTIGDELEIRTIVRSDDGVESYVYR
jgi:hypothetical protein